MAKPKGFELGTEMNYIISLSGGKDSTAMLHMMLERQEGIHSIVHFDTGWEFPQMHDHLREVEQKAGLEIMRLKPHLGFDYWMYERPIVARKGPMKGKVYRIGNGWPAHSRRWCTREKINVLEAYRAGIADGMMCVGFAAGEERRTESLNVQRHPSRFPLIEWGVTEPQALEYCKSLGYKWGGLYDHFDRASCFCCPLQKLGELRVLRQYYPALWARMLEMDARIPGHNKGFREYATVHDLERRFADEDRQMMMF